MGVNQLSLFWAKRDNQSGAIHPVICHLLDVASVALPHLRPAGLRLHGQHERDARYGG